MIHVAYIGNNPGMPTSGDQEGLVFGAPQELLYTRLLLSRPVEIPGLPNTSKQAQRIRQNEETEDYVPNQSIRQNLNKLVK